MSIGPSSIPSRETRQSPEEVAQAVLLEGLQDQTAIRKYLDLLEQAPNSVDEVQNTHIRLALHTLIAVDARCAAGNTIFQFIENTTPQNRCALQSLVQLGAFTDVLFYGKRDFEIPADNANSLLNESNLSPNQVNDLLEELSFAIHLQNGMNFQNLQIMMRNERIFLIACDRSAEPILPLHDISSQNFEAALHGSRYHSQYISNETSLMIITHGRLEAAQTLRGIIENLTYFHHPPAKIAVLNDRFDERDQELRKLCNDIASDSPEITFTFVGKPEREKIVDHLVRATIAEARNPAEVRMRLNSFLGEWSGAGGNRNLAALLSGAKNYIVIDDDISFTVPGVTQSGTEFEVLVDFYSNSHRAISHPGVHCASYRYSGHVDIAT
ncbi:MAG: hypothetical protein KDD60_11650, partial [Bdellovibrionales bacterium]|nr:hypothetical protein [Bdellovibrionales bacterium]